MNEINEHICYDEIEMNAQALQLFNSRTFENILETSRTSRTFENHSGLSLYITTLQPY